MSEIVKGEEITARGSAFEIGPLSLIMMACRQTRQLRTSLPPWPLLSGRALSRNKSDPRLQLWQSLRHRPQWLRAHLFFRNRHHQPCAMGHRGNCKSIAFGLVLSFLRRLRVQAPDERVNVRQRVSKIIGIKAPNNLRCQGQMIRHRQQKPANRSCWSIFWAASVSVAIQAKA